MPSIDKHIDDEALMVEDVDDHMLFFFFTFHCENPFDRILVVICLIYIERLAYL